jgi:hypothetical protein
VKIESRACGSFQDFLDRRLLLTRKILNQGFLLVKLKSSLRKLYGRHHDLGDRYGIPGICVTNDHGYVPLVEFVLHDLLCVCFVDCYLFFLSFFAWPLCCLYIFDLRILIIPLVSSKSSCWWNNLIVYRL